MKKSEIKQGGVYKAVVSNILCDVRVDGIHKASYRDKSITRYDVTNLRTGRKLTFNSAAKFRSEVKVKSTMDKLTPQQKAHISKGPQHQNSEDKQGKHPTAETTTVQATAEGKKNSPFPSSSDVAATDAPAMPASESELGIRDGGNDTYVSCDTCDGKGYIDEDGERFECPDCDGTGEVPEKVPQSPVEPSKSVQPVQEPPNPSGAVVEASGSFIVQGTETSRHYHKDSYFKEAPERSLTPSETYKALQVDILRECPLCGGEVVSGRVTHNDIEFRQCKKCSREFSNKKKTVSGLAAKLLRKEVGLPPHLIVEARAGVGKTTSIIEGLKVMRGEPSKFTPSPQQAAIWESMALSRDAQSVCLVAFNKGIATELQKRVPPGVNACTMHSLGYGAVRARFGNVKPESWTTTDIIADLLGRDIRELRKDPKMLGIVKATEDLVSKCKMNLSETDPESLEELATYYGIEMESPGKVFELVPKVLEEAMDPSKRGKITFDDMIWLCVMHDLPVPKYDLLCVDEAQDLNRCQQTLVRKVGRRIILVGDPKQAIYQFSGSDSRSIENMRAELSGDANGCVVLPLTVTRRCGRAIVKEANKYVPDFQAHESNGDGKVSYDLMHKYHAQVKDGDMVICKNNAPLISQCFKFLKADRRAHIQGRDIGKGLISLIDKLMPDEMERSRLGSAVDFSGKLSDWLHNEIRKENAKRTPSDSKISALQDRADCLACFAENSKSVYDILLKIERIFTDENTTGIRLSSCHKAKGLESDRVFILQPKGATILQGAKTDWQREQNQNLLYVSITRAISELVYVYDEEK